MKNIKFGTGWAGFIIFFGVAVIEAFREFNIYEIIFWLAMGAVFIFADNMDKRKSSQS